MARKTPAKKPKRLPRNLVVVTESNYASAVDKQGLTLLYIWGEHCGPCQTIKPMFEEKARRNSLVTFGTVNTTDSHIIATHLGVRRVPMLVCFYYNVLIYSEPMTADPAMLQRIIDVIKDMRPNSVRRSAGLPDIEVDPNGTG